MKQIIKILTFCLMTSMTNCGQAHSPQGEAKKTLVNDSDIIYGKWKYVGNDTDYNELIFKENGEYFMRIYWNNDSNYNEIGAKYSIDGNRIKIFDDNGSNELEYRLTNNRLTIKNYIQLEQDNKKVVKDAVYEKVE